MNYLTNEQIEKAVDWWSKQITNPKFDAGADSKEMQLAEVMASMLTTPTSDASIEHFKNVLRDVLKDKDYNPHQGLHVDYHPDRILQECAKASDVNVNNFPWKTGMYFDEDGGVTVRLGYGAEQEEL